jgi:hypothetical protein
MILFFAGAKNILLDKIGQFALLLQTEAGHVAQVVYLFNPIGKDQMTTTENISLACAKRARFLPDAAVVGFLLNADIFSIGFGNIYANDSFTDGEFIRFTSLGTDNRNGWDIVKTTIGNFVIVTFAEHAKERGLCLLKQHIAINPEYYAALAAESNGGRIVC